MGQLHEILQVLQANSPDRYCVTAVGEARRRLDEVKQLVMDLHGSAYLGIHSPDLHDDNRVLYDMHQVIRHRLSWDRNPVPGWDVSKDPPSKISTSGERLIHVTPATDEDRKWALVQSLAWAKDIDDKIRADGKHDDGITREMRRLEGEITNT